MANGGRGNLRRGKGQRRSTPNISQRHGGSNAARTPTLLPSQYDFTPSISAPENGLPQRRVPSNSGQPHFRDFPPPEQLFQNSPPAPLQARSPLLQSPLSPLQNSQAAPLESSQDQSIPSSEANDFHFHGEDEDDVAAPVDPVLQEDLLRLLNALLLVLGRENFTTVLSPIPKPNTTWFGRDKGALVRKITKVFTNKFDCPYYSWTVVPRDRQERYFIEFAKTHTWDPLLSGTVQEQFEKICQRRMKDMVSTVRTSRVRPTWINPTLWTEMTTFWDIQEAKDRSSTTSTARNSQRNGLGPHIHLSGQKSYAQIQQEMEEELGRPVSIGEVFINTHTKPDGTLVDVKAKNIAETYTMKLSELKAQNSETLDGDPTPPEISIDDQNELFRCTFRDDRGRPFGLGSLENTIVNGKRKYPGTCSSSFVALQQQLQEAQRKIEEQADNNARRDEELAAREAEISRVAAEQQNKLEHFSLVEKFLRATDPAFVDFIDSQPAPSTTLPTRHTTPS